MKPKPPSKKARLDGPINTGEGIPKKVTIKQEKMDPPPKAATAATASELLAAVKLAAAATAAQMSNARLTYPHLYYPEMSRDYPRMTHLISAVASKAPDTVQMLPIDDVDALQYELESLWTAVLVRIRTLQAENEALEASVGGGGSTVLGDHYDAHHQEKINAVKSFIDSGHGTRTSVSAAAKLVMGVEPPPAPETPPPVLVPIQSPVAGSSRKSNNSAAAATIGPIPTSLSVARQPKKKLKAEMGGKVKLGGNKPARAGQNRSHSMSMDDSSQRMEAPNQFWDFADSYCREVTIEDLNALDKKIEEFRELPASIFTIPPLGKHFKEAAGGSSEAAAQPASQAQETREAKTKDVCGPLTQRLVSALVEDRVAQHNTLLNGGTRDDQNGDGFPINRPGLVRALGLDGAAGSASPVPLESRLKQVLLEQGLLLADEAEDQTASNPDDGIMDEIQRAFRTLKKLHSYNVGKLDRLAASARQEYTRNCHKKELEKADKEIIDAYRAIASCRIKRKPITPKERNAAAKALQNRQTAIDNLSSVDMEDLTLTFNSAGSVSNPQSGRMS